MSRALSDREDGLKFDAGRLNVGEYLERWLEDSVKDTVRPSTYQRHEELTKLHLVPALGRLKLQVLAPMQVRRLYREKLDGGLSSATVQKMHVVLHKALGQAVRYGLVPRNVTEAVKLPQIKREEIKALSAEETKKLLKAAKGDKLEALYVLAVTTGMRQGEILGLK